MFSFFAALWDQFIFEPIYNLVIFSYNQSPGPNLGWAIIGIALIIRFVFLYFTLVGYQHDLELAEIKPELSKIENDPKLSAREKIARVSALTKPKGINPIASAIPLFAQLFFLGVLYQIIQYNLSADSYRHLYDFVSSPGKINTIFFGIDLAHPSLLLGLVAAALLFFERLWEYGEKKDLRITSFSQKWDPLIWPLGSFIILMILPSVKALFLITSVAFSLIIKGIVHGFRRA